MPDESKQLRGPTIRSAGGVRVGKSLTGPLDLPLPKAAVTQCRIDHAFSLVLDEVDSLDRVWIVRVSGPFSLTDSKKRRKRTTVFDGDEAPPSGWGPAIDALLYANVVSSSVAAEGALSLHLETGRLEVPAQTDWEAWQIDGPNGFLAVCEMGGQVSRWTSESS